MPSGLFSTLFQPSPAESLPDDLKRPYGLLSDPADPATNQQIQEGADSIYLPFHLDPANPNSYVQRFGKPDGFDTPPNQLPRATFLSWHSQVQLSYIYKNLANQNAALQIGSPPDTATVMLSPANADPANPGNRTEMINISSMTVSTFGQLSSEDRLRVSSDATFITQVAPGLQLTTVLDELTSDANSPLGKLSQLLNGSTALIQQLQTLANSSDDAKESAEAAIETLKKQIAEFFEQIESGLVFDGASLNTAAQEIVERIERLDKYAKAINDVTKDTNITYNSDMLFNNSNTAFPPEQQLTRLRSTFNSFINADRALDASLAASKLVTDREATDELGRRLDAPGLMAAFVFNLSLKMQALNQADTVQFEQLNELIKHYGVIQRLVNQTLEKFDSSDTKQKLALGGGTEALANLSLSPEERAALSMFLGNVSITVFSNNPPPPSTTTTNIKPGSTEHPIEGLSGVTRPTIDIASGGFSIKQPDGSILVTSITLKKLDRQAWQTVLQQLNDGVTLLNQSSQLQFNEITSRSQQRTTFFEAASNALAKGQDVLQSITRNIG